MEIRPAVATGHKLEIRDLCTTVGEFHLGPITLTMQRGDYLVLMGASGCGKTTLLKTIAGLLTQESGEIWLDGTRIDTFPSSRRRVGHRGKDCPPKAQYGNPCNLRNLLLPGSCLAAHPSSR